jgi:hypothetical protein
MAEGPGAPPVFLSSVIVIVLNTMATVLATDRNGADRNGQTRTRERKNRWQIEKFTWGIINKHVNVGNGSRLGKVPQQRSMGVAAKTSLLGEKK